MTWQTLFASPYREKIESILPVLFNMVELENKRGKKLGMEVGTARERVIIALCMYAYGDDKVKFPASTSHERDVIVNNRSLSIKTKSGAGCSGVKLSWTVDREKAQAFAKKFRPQSDMLYINSGLEKTGRIFSYSSRDTARGS